MAKATATEVYNVPIDKFYSVITDYESYPEFVDGVSSVNVIENNETEALVEYSLNIIKKFSYKLKLKHNKPFGISWTFEGGDLFKENTGGWILKDLGENKTEVTYSLDVNMKGFIPKKIIDMLTTKNLPSMMKAFHDRVNNL